MQRRSVAFEAPNSRSLPCYLLLSLDAALAVAVCICSLSIHPLRGHMRVSCSIGDRYLYLVTASCGSAGDYEAAQFSCSMRACSEISHHRGGHFPRKHRAICDHSSACGAHVGILRDMAHTRILLVDDHEVVRLGLKSLLDARAEIEVVDDVGTADEALRKAHAHRPDVVLMDIRLPGRSGIEATERIVKELPDTKVIMLTSYAEDEMLFGAIRAGAVGYVLKQVGTEDLIRTIEAVVRGDGSLDPALTQRVFSEIRKSIRLQDAAAFAELTRQELRILALITEGKTNREIANVLYLGEGTVRNYVSRILSKLDVSNRAEAAVYAVKHNIQQVVGEG